LRQPVKSTRPRRELQDSQFHKRAQLSIRRHNETLSIAAMRVNNPLRLVK
jgi:hypothetical protein